MGASQRAVPWWLRAYLLLNAVQDLGLALNGLLAPDRYDLTFPRTVTPLNGRFIGALYLAAGVGIILSACAREPAEARIFVVGFGVVSLLALIVTVWYWREFTVLGRPTTWLFTYSVDPPLAVFTLWRLRLWRPAVPAYHRLSPLFIAECALLGSIGLVLLAAPQLAIKAWPWVINILRRGSTRPSSSGFAVGALLAVREASVPTGDPADHPQFAGADGAPPARHRAAPAPLPARLADLALVR